MVESGRGGRSPESLSKEFEPMAPAIRNRVRTAAPEEGGRSDGRTREERPAFREFRQENRRLREERDLPEKAAARFARETMKGPSASRGRLRPSFGFSR